jgi:hypothetical protein
MKIAVFIFVLISLSTVVFGQTTGSDTVSELMGLSLNALQRKLPSNLKIEKRGDVYMVANYPQNGFSQFSIDSQKGLNNWTIIYPCENNTVATRFHKIIMDTLKESYGNPLDVGKQQMFYQNLPEKIYGLIVQVDQELVVIVWQG